MAARRAELGFKVECVQFQSSAHHLSLGWDPRSWREAVLFPFIPPYLEFWGKTTSIHPSVQQTCQVLHQAPGAQKQNMVPTCKELTWRGHSIQPPAPLILPKDSSLQFK